MRRVGVNSTTTTSKSHNGGTNGYSSSSSSSFTSSSSSSWRKSGNGKRLGLSFVKAIMLVTVGIAVTVFTVSLRMYHHTRARQEQEARAGKTSTAGMLHRFHQEIDNANDVPTANVVVEKDTGEAGSIAVDPAGSRVHRHGTKKEASEAMLRQPSTWVDGEKQLRQKLLPLQRQQVEEKKNLGLAVLTRWLGDAAPAFGAPSQTEQEWQAVVDPLLEESSRRAKQEDEARRARDAQRPKKLHLTQRRKQWMRQGETTGSSETTTTPDHTDSDEKKDNRSKVKPPRILQSTQTSEYPRPFDASEYIGHKVVRMEPAFGKHRLNANAIFAFAEGYDLHTYVGFIESLRQEAPSFDGDIVLSVSSLHKLKRGVEQYLQSQANVVVYTVDWTCFVPATLTPTDEGPKEGQNICQVHGLYGAVETSIAEQLGAESTPLADPRDPRPVATARYELYWSWATQYSPQSWILLIDSRDTHFQQNPFAELPPLDQNDNEAGKLYLFEENAEAVPIGKSPFNRKWLETAYGAQRVASFMDQPVVCSGSTMGQQPAIEAYLRAMVAQYDDTQCKMKGCDQGFHNYLLYSQTLETLVGIAEIEVFSQGTGIVNNLGLLRQVPLRERGILTPDKDLVLNWDGSTSRVAHQVDRDEELNRIIKKRKAQYQTQWFDARESLRRNAAAAAGGGGGGGGDGTRTF